MNGTTHFAAYRAAYQDLVRLGLQTPTDRELSRFDCLIETERTQLPGSLALTELLYVAQKTASRSLAHLIEQPQYFPMRSFLWAYRRILRQARSAGELGQICQLLIDRLSVFIEK